jgi:hypothetical protein
MIMQQDQTALAYAARDNIRNLAQRAAQGILIALAVGASIATIMAIVGVIPWVSLNVISTSGDSVFVGVWFQALGTALLLGLCAFLPSVHHIQHLEKSHRNFKLSMDDVARAYQISHTSDRSGTFVLSSEFEDMRERLDSLRRHPDLGHLEPEILEVAAQMSHMTRDLARVYSDDKVARAKDFLRHRQHELDAFSEKLSLALSVTQELQRWQKDVEATEREVNRQMDRLEKDLQEILPQLGYEMDDDRPEGAKTDDGKVVALSTGGPAMQSNGLERPN